MPLDLADLVADMYASDAEAGISFVKGNRRPLPPPPPVSLRPLFLHVEVAPGKGIPSGKQSEQ